jgi:hypothetical protein
MAEAENSAGEQTVTSEWMRIGSSVAEGVLTPQDGIAALQALAEAHPDDRDWLQEEMEMIRHRFGLDIADLICDGTGGYWDKLLSVIEALLDERLDHKLALALLETINTQHPEYAEDTTALKSDIENSPLRQLLTMDD